MRITVYQWTAANGRTKYSWFLGDNVDHDRAVEVAESIYSTAEDIVDVTVDAGGRIRHNVTGKYDTF